MTLSDRKRSSFVTSSMLIVALAMPTMARAQQHVVDDAALGAAVARKVSTENVQRAQLAKFMAREDVQRATNRLGLDARTMESAVAGLTGERLDRATRAVEAATDSAAPAKRADPKVTLSLTAILLIILLVVLIVD